MNFRASPLTLVLFIVLIGVAAWKLWGFTHPKVIHRPAPAVSSAPARPA